MLHNMKISRNLKLSITVIMTMSMIVPTTLITPVKALPLTIWWTNGDSVEQCGTISVHIMLSDSSQVGSTFIVGRYIGWTVENWGQVTMQAQHADVILNVPCNAPIGPGLDIQARSGWLHTSNLIDLNVITPATLTINIIPDENLRGDLVTGTVSYSGPIYGSMSNQIIEGSECRWYLLSSWDLEWTIYN